MLPQTPNSIPCTLLSRFACVLVPRRPSILESANRLQSLLRQEEYRLINTSYVLPEFLVQYRFSGRNGSSSSALASCPPNSTAVPNALAGLQCSLESPELHLPSYLSSTRDAKSIPHLATQITAFPLTAGWDSGEGAPDTKPTPAQDAPSGQPQQQPSWDLAQVRHL